MENAPHPPGWMSGQCKLLKELLRGLGEEWLAEDMEGVEGGAGTNILDSDIVLTDPEDGGTPWDKFAGGGMGGDGPESARVWGQVGWLQKDCLWATVGDQGGWGRRRGGGGWRPLHSLGSTGGWKWPCIRGNCVSRPWEVTPNGFRYQASRTTPASVALRKG